MIPFPLLWLKWLSPLDNLPLTLPIVGSKGGFVVCDKNQKLFSLKRSRRLFPAALFFKRNKSAPMLSP